MKTTKVENTKAQFPTIVKINNDYYVLSETLDINGNLEIISGSRIAINLNTGTWFDFSEIESHLQIFEKGTKFEIEI